MSIHVKIKLCCSLVFAARMQQLVAVDAPAPTPVPAIVVVDDGDNEHVKFEIVTYTTSSL